MAGSKTYFKPKTRIKVWHFTPTGETNATIFRQQYLPNNLQK